MINDYNITNAQVLEHINKRLYEVQNNLGHISIDKPKNKKWKIISQLGSYALFIIGGGFFAAAFLGPAGVNAILFSKMITALIFAGLGGTSLGVSQFFDSRMYKAEKQETGFNTEAALLQNARDYINEALPITKEIQNKIVTLKKEIYQKEQEQYGETAQQIISSSNNTNYSNPQAIEVPFVVQGNIMDFAKKEYLRLKVDDFAGDSYYFISAIDNGKYNSYTPTVLSELKNLAVCDIAQRFYGNLVITYSLTPDMIISNVRKGLYRDKHIKEVLEEVINIATYYKEKDSEAIKKAV